jgi:hypothetical protein
MARSAWSLYDAIEVETYVFPVNPYQDSGSFAVEKQISYTVVGTSLYNDPNQIFGSNSAVIFPGGDKMAEMNFSGRTYDQAQLDALSSWGNRGYPVEITDDLGRVFSIYISSIAPSRKRSRNRWKHEYEFKAYVLEEIFE